MTRLLLERKASTANSTLGFLHTPKGIYATIERPWIPNPNGAPGGKPSESCCPDGLYDLRPFRRPNGDDVVALVNPDLGVYFKKADMPQPEHGRFLILIHAGNWVRDIEGCIAPGIKFLNDPANEPMVLASRAAMKEVMAERPRSIEIRWIEGEPT